MVLRRIVYGVLNMVACIAPNCALRAPTVFGTNKKRIRTENKVPEKARTGLAFLSRIDDPRGRAAVRAIAEMDDVKASRPDSFGFVRQGY